MNHLDLDLDLLGLTVLHDGPLADCVVPEERGNNGVPLGNRYFPDGTGLIHQYQCRAGGGYYVFVQSKPEVDGT